MMLYNLKKGWINLFKLYLRKKSAKKVFFVSNYPLPPTPPPPLNRVCPQSNSLWKMTSRSAFRCAGRGPAVTHPSTDQVLTKYWLCIPTFFQNFFFQGFTLDASPLTRDKKDSMYLCYEKYDKQAVEIGL